jgi:hypothetical protein
MWCATGRRLTVVGVSAGLFLLIVVSATGSAPPAGQASGSFVGYADLEPGETAVAPDQLPRTVKNAVRDRMAGFEIVAAKREVVRSGRTIFAVLGRVEGRLYEMEVSPSGQILEVEEEGDEDDKDSPDEDDDDDDGPDDD